MKTQKYILGLACLLMIQGYAWSQQGVLKANINYGVGIPVGSFKTVTNEVSPRGWNASVLYGVTDNLSLGLGTGYQDFYQRYPRQITYTSGSDLSAVVTNSVQVTPILLTGKYRLSATGKIEPFAALGVGANFINYRKFYGEFADNRSTVGFAAQPELGVYIPFTSAKRTGLNLSAGYNIMPFKYNDVTNLNHLAIKGGISFTLR
jgi:hypothetical protein